MGFGFDFGVLLYYDLVGEGGLHYILVRIVFRLEMLDELSGSDNRACLSSNV